MVSSMYVSFIMHCRQYMLKNSPCHYGTLLAAGFMVIDLFEVVWGINNAEVLFTETMVLIAG